MLVKDIHYEDLDGKEQTFKAYFHMNKGDRARLSARKNNYGEYLTALAEAGDREAMVDELEYLIKASYGVRKGDKFDRSPETVDAFVSSEAYGELLFQLCTDSDAFKTFFSTVLGVDMSKIEQEQAGLPEATSPQA